MILAEFSKYLQQHNQDIIDGKMSATKYLCRWIAEVIKKNPKNNVDKIVHREVILAENSTGDFFITARSDSGRVLVNALYKFALSYENFIMTKWLADKKPHHFKLP